MEIAIVLRGQIDEHDLSQFINTYEGDEDIAHLLQSPRLVCVYTAIYEAKIIGTLIAWTNTFHPFCTYFRIILHPSYDHMPTVERLITTAKQHPSIRLPLQTSIWETSKRLKDFYTTNGFVEIRKTYTPLLRISRKDVVEKKEGRYIAVALNALVEEARLIEQLTQLAKKNYVQTHLDNPVGEVPLTAWENLVLADDIIMDGSFVYVDEEAQEITAYSFLHTSENEETVELGWCGCKDMDQIQLISPLVHLQIQYAKERGIKYIEGEFDTTSPYAMHVYEEIGFPQSTSWISYQSAQDTKK